MIRAQHVIYVSPLGQYSLCFFCSTFRHTFVFLRNERRSTCRSSMLIQTFLLFIMLTDFFVGNLISSYVIQQKSFFLIEHNISSPVLLFHNADNPSEIHSST
ncbi:hypothetical protein Smp_166160 [Schistosoma mansoni]|uniref:hypothetical protein n=1 Tax=Schistosoma mansoni TaxID=6183 RepID=UPI0001A620F9|nr:hypothetical protein Smp_166160 [Schistosoma mansoni]|eukprot:XP_018652188.1 hypothetical protein Smp_166160 [Schistosoma mansoni]